MSPCEVFQLETGRPGVVLRELTAEDDVAYFQAVEESREALGRYERISEKYQRLEDVAEARMMNRHKLRLGIWDGETFVGSANMTPDEYDPTAVELGYWVSTPHSKKGYATLAARALSLYACSMGKHVYAEVDEQNIGSVRVLERSGYEQVAQEVGRIIFHFSPERLAALMEND